MARALSPSQYDAVLGLVGEAHDTKSLDELREMILPGLRRIIPADYSSYNEVLGDGSPLVTIAEPELPPSAYEAWGKHAGSNPLVSRYQQTRDGRAYRFSDVVDMVEFRRSEIYSELYRPLGIEHQMAVILPSSPALVIGVALNRGPRDFSDAERAMLDLLRPHMIQAYRNSQLHERAAGVSGALRAGLDARGMAALIVDSDGVLLMATDRGARLAEQVALEPIREDERLPSRLATLLEGPATARVPIAGVDAVICHRVRAPEGTTVLFLDRAGSALNRAALEGLGLTAREAAVLEALARGATTADIAAETGTSPRTVAKHVQSIHRKLGVRDRAQAIATAWAATTAGDL